MSQNTSDQIVDIHLGSLAAEVSNGRVRSLDVDFFDYDDIDKSEDLFDNDDADLPNIPLLVSIDDRSASCGSKREGFICEVELDESQRPTKEDLQRYSHIVRAAQRIYERVKRGEPILAWSIQQHGEVPDIEQVLDVINPPPNRGRLADRASRKRSKDTVPTAHGLLRIDLVRLEKAEEDETLITLDVPILENLFPARVKNYFGIVHLNSRSRIRPIYVEESGWLYSDFISRVHLKYGGSSFASRRERFKDEVVECVFTSLLATRMIENETVTFWSDNFMECDVWRIVKVKKLVYPPVLGDAVATV